MDGKQVLGGKPTQTGDGYWYVATSWGLIGSFNMRELVAQRLTVGDSESRIKSVRTGWGGLPGEW